MPMYADITNAENIIAISEASREAAAFGPEKVAEALSKAILSKGKRVNVALEAWYGVPAAELAAAVEQSLKRAGVTVQVYSTASLFRNAEEIRAYKQTFITDDPGFGCVNMDGRLEDILDNDKIEALKKELAAGEGVRILAGPGAASRLLEDVLDMICFMDITREPMLWKMWDGELVPFGAISPDPNYMWKE